MSLRYLLVACLLVAGCRCGKKPSEDPELDPEMKAMIRPPSGGGPPIAHPAGADIPLGLDKAPGPPPVTSTVAAPKGANERTVGDVFGGKPVSYPPPGEPTGKKPRALND